MPTKTCSKCKEEKDLSEFYKKKEASDGVKSACKVCTNKKEKEYREINRDKIRKKDKEYRETNKGKIKEYNKNYIKNNPELNRAKAAKRKAAKLQRTPSWSDLEAIKEIYTQCPEGYHVDHIIPLQGALVSGLHIPENLQCIPAKENLSKNNKFKV